MTTQEILAVANIIKPENFVSIRELQKSPTKTLSSWDMKIILNNWKPVWVFFSIDQFEQLLEDIELLQDEQYLKDIEEARKETEEYSRDDVIKMFGLNV